MWRTIHEEARLQRNPNVALRSPCDRGGADASRREHAPADGGQCTLFKDEAGVAGYALFRGDEDYV